MPTLRPTCTASGSAGSASGTHPDAGMGGAGRQLAAARGLVALVPGCSSGLQQQGAAATGALKRGPSTLPAATRVTEKSGILLFTSCTCGVVGAHSGVGARLGGRARHSAGARGSLHACAFPRPFQPHLEADALLAIEAADARLEGHHAVVPRAAALAALALCVLGGPGPHVLAEGGRMVGAASGGQCGGEVANSTMGPRCTLPKWQPHANQACFAEAAGLPGAHLVPHPLRLQPPVPTSCPSSQLRCQRGSPPAWCPS